MVGRIVSLNLNKGLNDTFYTDNIHGVRKVCLDFTLAMGFLIATMENTKTGYQTELRKILVRFFFSNFTP